jgi:hypothetical protein
LQLGGDSDVARRDYRPASRTADAQNNESPDPRSGQDERSVPPCARRLADGDDAVVVARWSVEEAAGRLALRVL